MMRPFEHIYNGDMFTVRGIDECSMCKKVLHVEHFHPYYRVKMCPYCVGMSQDEVTTYYTTRVGDPQHTALWQKYYGDRTKWEQWLTHFFPEGPKMWRDES